MTYWPFGGKSLDSPFNPNEEEDEGFVRTLAEEAPEVDPKRPTCGGAAVEVTFGDSPVDPNREDEDIAGTLAAEGPAVDPNREDGDIAGTLAAEGPAVDPNREDGDIAGTLAAEGPEVDPKNVLTFDGTGLAAAYDSTPGPYPEGLCFSGKPVGDLTPYPKTGNELGAGDERAPSKPNGDVDAVLVLWGAAPLASVLEVEEDGGGVNPAAAT
jgi:hypothetical protein